MKDGEIKKYQRYQNQSLLALTSNNQPQPTKKNIQTEQFIGYQPMPTSNNRKYFFFLPFTTEISAIISHISTRFSESIIHVQGDSKSAQVILQGLKLKGFKRTIKQVLDYLVFCCSKGVKFGVLQQTYNVIVINIKKEVIQNRCVISVTNPYRKQELYSIFINKILEPIQQQIKSLVKQSDLSNQEQTVENQYLNQSSPMQLQLHIHTKIYHLFVLHDFKDLSRYKNIFLHSIEKIKHQFDKYQQKMKASTSKKNLPSPSGNIQSIIQESQSLLACLRNSYKQEQNHQSSYLHSLVTSECAQQISLYKIEQLLCFYLMPSIKVIYSQITLEQCAAFNNNMALINKKFTDLDCFQHLELKEKFRLPKEQMPYFSAIQRLKTIEYCISLRQMLFVIQQTFSQVKTCCLICHQGKLELSSMDDMLPVMIFVTLRANIINFPIYVKLIDDYINLKGTFELEQRVMMTLSAAVSDISRTWDKIHTED